MASAETQVDTGSKIATETHRCDFNSISRCCGSKDAPGEHSSCPTSITGILGAKKVTKIKEVMAARDVIITTRGPTLGVMYPFSKAPMMLPMEPISVNPACQAEEI